MSFSNRIFNVNGKTEAMLRDALKLVFAQEGDHTRAHAWVEHPEHGIILLWGIPSTGDYLRPYSCSKFLSPLTAEEVTPLIVTWLKSDEAKIVKCEHWDANADHDGSNSLGWRVYCGDWGHVGEERYSICAVKPAWIWYGK